MDDVLLANIFEPIHPFRNTIRCRRCDHRIPFDGARCSSCKSWDGTPSIGFMIWDRIHRVHGHYVPPESIPHEFFRDVFLNKMRFERLRPGYHRCLDCNMIIPEVHEDCSNPNCGSPGMSVPPILRSALLYSAVYGRSPAAAWWMRQLRTRFHRSYDPQEFIDDDAELKEEFEVQLSRQDEAAPRRQPLRNPVPDMRIQSYQDTSTHTVHGSRADTYRSVGSGSPDNPDYNGLQRLAFPADTATEADGFAHLATFPTSRGDDDVSYTGSRIPTSRHRHRGPPQQTRFSAEASPFPPSNQAPTRPPPPAMAFPPAMPGGRYEYLTQDQVDRLSPIRFGRLDESEDNVPSSRSSQARLQHEVSRHIASNDSPAARSSYRAQQSPFPELQHRSPISDSREQIATDPTIVQQALTPAHRRRSALLTDQRVD